jgi:hypothetical protein
MNTSLFITKQLRLVIKYLLILLIALYFFGHLFLFIDRQVSETVINLSRFFTRFHYDERAEETLAECILLAKKGQIHDVFRVIERFILLVDSKTYRYPYRKHNVRQELQFLENYFFISTPYLQLTIKFFFLHFYFSEFMPLVLSL